MPMPRKEHKLGHPNYSQAEMQRRGYPEPGKNGGYAEMNVPQPVPDGDPEWHPQTRSWWRGIGQSQIARSYDTSDWATAWTAALVLDQMHCDGFRASLLAEFGRMTARLGLTVVDRAKNGVAARRADPDAEADAAVEDGLAEIRTLFAITDEETS